jgi:dihydroorotase-like cyclic amidohydrolase
VTTVIEHTHGGPVRTRAELDRKRDHLADRSRVDFALGAHAWPDALDEVPALWEGGIAFFKVFTCTTHGVPGFDDVNLLELLRRVSAVGGVCLAHCESEAITAQAERVLRAAGRDDGGIVPEWRNPEAEMTATGMVALLARLTGARTVVAHVSSPDVLALVTRERRAGASIAAESCPQYLVLLEDDVRRDGAFRKFTPPARAAGTAGLDAMWAALASGEIEYVASDHAPSTRAQKSAGSIWDAPFGLPGVDTTLSTLLDGAHAGRISYERVVEAYSERPARMYGLFPRKGSLAEGADADVVLVDPEASWTVSDADVKSKAGWSPFSGRTLRGRAARAYLRGELVARGDDVLAEPGTGRFVPGPGASAGR